MVLKRKTKKCLLVLFVQTERAWKGKKNIIPNMVIFKMAADPDIQKRKRLEGEEYKNSELPQEDELPTLPKHHLGE